MIPDTRSAIKAIASSCKTYRDELIRDSDDGKPPSLSRILDTLDVIDLALEAALNDAHGVVTIRVAGETYTGIIIDHAPDRAYPDNVQIQVWDVGIDGCAMTVTGPIVEVLP